MHEKHLSTLFHDARRNNDVVILEGFHAVKHAVRFGAQIVVAVTAHRAMLMELVRVHAPESTAFFVQTVRDITENTYRSLASRPPRTGVIAIARRPQYRLVDILRGSAPIVCLDDLRDLNNIGASVRVAAAYGVSGVIVVGDIDPWKPTCLRGSAGLHFAVPIVPVTQEEVLSIDAPLYVFDERGVKLSSVEIPRRSVIVFGSERSGVRQIFREHAQGVVRIAMREHVASLNVATAVAAGLYGGVYV